MSTRSLDDHLTGTGPKRILALDGGGIRGILTLGYLAEIEKILRERFGGDTDFRLCDYFDLIGGTSTGSIIAAGLALGFSVQELQSLYRTLGATVFKSGLLSILGGMLAPKFATAPVEVELKKRLGINRTLGDSGLRTGLMVMTKRMDTGSPWPLHNNPAGKYFGQQSGELNIPNGEFKLWQVVRASTAAPTYFVPELVEISTDHSGNVVRGAFVDGSISPHSNPALQLVMLATLQGFHFNWELGEDRLLVISVGTGYPSMHIEANKFARMTGVEMAKHAVTSMMADSDTLVRMQLQWMGRTLFSMPSDISAEAGDLSGDTLGGRKLLTYARYNAALSREWLKQELDLDFGPTERSLNAIDDVRNIERLSQVGERAAARQVNADHFPPVFDPALVHV
jgi:hypothetical protein